ncbi:MAG: hypothetical protein JW745_01350 [Sedimentisphaerales bacterium]|nr:hypothetical protein [Sedimentisphaerales bacterium]MBN2843008.1 hypothetical protein [Sedimentisphaerales bacterium]
MKNYLIYLSLLFLLSFCGTAYSWDNSIVHPALTEEAIGKSVLANGFLQSELDFNEGLSGKSELTEGLEANIDLRVSFETNKNHKPLEWKKDVSKSYKQWLVNGSIYEDQ